MSATATDSIIYRNLAVAPAGYLPLKGGVYAFVGVATFDGTGDEVDLIMLGPDGSTGIPVNVGINISGTGATVASYPGTFTLPPGQYKITFGAHASAVTVAIAQIPR